MLITFYLKCIDFLKNVITFVVYLNKYINNKLYNKMKAAQKVWESWKVQQEHGDVERIAEESGYHRNTIARALLYNDMTEETFEAIKKYYATKKDKVLK